MARPTLVFTFLALALACAGTQRVEPQANNGSLTPLNDEIDKLALLPSQLVRGEEPPESLGMGDIERDSVQMRDQAQVEDLAVVAATTSLQMLVVAEGQQIPIRVRLMSYEDGLHVYGVETMTAYDAEGRECPAAEAAADFLVSEAKAGRWATLLVDTESLGTELPSNIRMMMMDDAAMFTDVMTFGEVLADARVVRARLSDEVVVFARDTDSLALFQSVIKLDPNSARLRVLGPPHVVVQPLDGEAVSAASGRTHSL